MLQTLLADRFKFRAHRESKEVPVYALVAGKNRARLKPGSDTGQCSVRVGVAKDGRNTDETFSGCPIESLADRLTNIVGDRPVLDQTGLTGKYDFHLIVTAASRSLGRSDPSDISVNVAVGELRLRLIPQKARIDILAVDHFERPTEN